MNELFRMNEHGDIWQEPTLFDQGGDVPETSSSAPRDANYDEECPHDWRPLVDEAGMWCRCCDEVLI